MRLRKQAVERVAELVEEHVHLRERGRDLLANRRRGEAHHEEDMGALRGRLPPWVVHPGTATLALAGREVEAE